MHLKHVPLKHRIIASCAIITIGIAVWWITKAESAKMAAELALAPHLDRLIYGLE